MSEHVSISNLYTDLQRSMKTLRKDASAVEASRAYLNAAIEDGSPTYGVNTGFGKLASKKIAPEDQERLQRNLLLSHAVGVGESVPKPISRLMLFQY